MSLNRIDQWTSEDINKILASIEEHRNEKEASYLNKYETLKDTEYYADVQKVASIQSRVSEFCVCYGDYNRAIRVDVFRQDDECAAVEIFITEDDYKDCILHSFIFTSKDGKTYNCENFDESYRATWETEINQCPSLRFGLHEVNHKSGFINKSKPNEIKQYLHAVIAQYPSEKIADDFLSVSSVSDIISVLELNQDVALAARANEFLSIAKECIMHNEDIRTDCVLNLAEQHGIRYSVELQKDNIEAENSQQDIEH